MSMATAAQRLARKRKRQAKAAGRNGQRNTQQVTQTPSARTVVIKDTYKGLIDANGTSTQNMVALQPNTNWPAFKAAAEGHLFYRIRSATVTFQSVKQDANGVLSMLLTHPGSVWKPTGFYDAKNRGGNMKPLKSSGWSTSLVDASVDWLDKSQTGASLYLFTSDTAAVSNAGMVSVTLTVQFRGLA